METISRSPIFEQLSSLADRARSRLLLALEQHELTVSELCSVLQLPQSTVSRQLKILGQAGWVSSRPDGTRRLYQLSSDDLDATGRRLWELTRGPVRDTAAAGEDARRLEAVLARRRQRSREFFDSASARWDRLRDEMFGGRFYLLALLGLLDSDMTLADLGCGTGPVAEALAPMVRQVVAVDGSEAMLSAARQRLRRLDNVELRRGDLEALPIDDDGVDAATLVLVLHHLPDPGRVLREVARVLRPDGRLLVVDMLPHERKELQQEMGHVWMGFREEQLRRFLDTSGLTLTRFKPLPPEAEAKGPTLFAATAAA